MANYLPDSAVDTVFDFLNRHEVYFHITRRRSSKLGDYRMPQPKHNYHEISVNGDLPPHLFLLVLLHEMAHLNTFLIHGRSVQPHGHEWQQQYRLLIVQYWNEGHFPTEATPYIRKYTARIPLNSVAGVELEHFLRRYDRPTSMPVTLLRNLPIGSLFRIKERPEILFRSVEKRRTRYQCVDENTKLSFLVSGNAEVVVVSNE